MTATNNQGHLLKQFKLTKNFFVHVFLVSAPSSFNSDGSTQNRTVNKMNLKLRNSLAVILLGAAVLSTTSTSALASGSGGGGGGGGSTETIKIDKCFFQQMSAGSTYCQMLIKAGSTNGNAHLYAYNQTGMYIGEVQNGSGGRYGGTVFITPVIPTLVTIVSSSGASASTVPGPFVP